MSKRMRVIGWAVQPVIMADDGENLTPVQVQGQQIPVAHWQAFKNGGDDQALARVRDQVENGQPPAAAGAAEHAPEDAAGG